MKKQISDHAETLASLSGNNKTLIQTRIDKDLVMAANAKRKQMKLKWTELLDYLLTQFVNGKVK